MKLFKRKKKEVVKPIRIYYDNDLIELEDWEVWYEENYGEDWML